MKTLRLVFSSLLIIATGLQPVAMTGCCSTQLTILADGVDASTEEIFREYNEIVIEGKPRPPFDDDDKEIRRNSLKKVKELLDEARK